MALHPLFQMAAAAIAGSSNNPIDISALTGTLSRSAFTTSGNPVTATAGVRLQTDGTLQTSEGTGTGSSYADKAAGQWYISEPSSGIGAGFEVRVTINSGSLDAGDAINTWIALSTERTWGTSETSDNGSTSANLTLEIRRAGGATVLRSATFTIQATVTSI